MKIVCIKHIYTTFEIEKLLYPEKSDKINNQKFVFTYK